MANKIKLLIIIVVSYLLVSCETRCNCSEVTVWNDGYIERYDYLTDWCDTDVQYSEIGRDYISVTTCY